MYMFSELQIIEFVVAHFTPLQIGFSAGDGVRLVELEDSGLVSVSRIDYVSNVGLPGRFVFKVASENISATTDQLACEPPGSTTFFPISCF